MLRLQACEPRVRACGLAVRVIALMLLAGGLAGPLAGCASTPRSTRLTATDLSEIASAMAADLRSSEFMKQRDAASERMTITMDRVENLSADLVPRREQWFIMAQLQGSAALVELGRQKGFVMVLPAEQSVGSAARLEGDTAFARREASHELTGTLRSATRSDGTARTDVYLADFRLTTLASGEVLWTGTYELKREAMGRSFD